MAQIGRRTLLGRLTSAVTLSGAATLYAGAGNAKAAPRLRKIATEEAFIVPEFIEPIRALVAKGGVNLDLPLLKRLSNLQYRTQLL